MSSRENNYSIFAEFYDDFMTDYDYLEVARFIEQVIRREEVQVSHIIEMACGTGKLTDYLTQVATVEAFDLSQDMLSLAYHRHYRNKRVTLYPGDMRDFSPRRKAELVLCLCDSLNYLKNSGEIEETFSSVYESLQPGGLFLFDVNTPSHFRDFYGNQIEVEEGENYYFTWQNQYEEDIGENHYLLNFFLEEERGLYKRFVEEHIEYTYTIEELKEKIDKQNLKLLHIYNGYEMNPDITGAKRWVFVVKREEV